MDFPNRVLTSLPTFNGEHYVHRTPLWLIRTMRSLFALGGAFLLWQVLRGNDPLLVRGFMVLLAAGFWLFAFARQIWEKVVRFVADRQGIYFPSNDLVVSVLGRPQVHQWLFVPWCNIRNLRLAYSIDNDGDRGLSIVFDVQLADTQEVDFFRHVAHPEGQVYASDGARSLAYRDNPPAPKDTLARLQALEPIQRLTTVA